MRILTIAARHNPYPFEIYDYLNDDSEIEVVVDSHKFWCPDLFDFDIIHIHWPEFFVSGINIESIYEYKRNMKSELYTLNEVLKKWRKKAKIIYTIHNLYNHNDHTRFLELVYQIVYTHSDVFVHLAQASIEAMKERYTKTEEKVNVVIPHNMNELYLNNTNKAASRSKLGLKTKDKVILIFGDLRTEEEKDFVLQVFRKVNIKNKKLLVARWKSDNNIIALQVEKFILAMKNIVIGSVNHFVKEEDIQYYFNATDVLLCPRNESLNSGLIALSTAFSTPIVGPKTGNIEECLDALNAQSFISKDVIGAAKSLENELLDKDLATKGQEMHAYAKKHWSVARIAKMHKELYLKFKV